MRKHPLKVLFFPWSHGAGFGYIGRALKIAEELREHGHTCVFACDTSDSLIARCGFEVVAFPSEHSEAVEQMGARQGQYIPIDNLDSAFGIAGYYHPTRVFEHVRQDLATIEAVKPDLIVIDMQPTASIAARRAGLPLVSAGDSDFIRDTPNSWMPWLSPEEACILPYPSCVNAFNEVLTRLGLTEIEHVTDLMWGDLMLLASTPELEANQAPIRMRGRLEYVGPVWWDPPWSDASAVLADFGSDAEKRIYITLGHGGKVSHSQIQAVLDACDRSDWAVFISLGMQEPTGALRLPANVKVGGFTGISEPIRWSDMVIHHGGYSTALVSMLNSKPAVIVPFMSEQEANGILFVEAHHAGFVLRRTMRASGPGRHFEHQLRYSGKSADGLLAAEEFRKAIAELSHPSYRAGAAKVSEYIRERIDGSSIPQLIESVLSQ